MLTDGKWKSLGFGTYILYLKNDYNIYVSTQHSNILKYEYFSCVLNQFMDSKAFFDIYNPNNDVRIKKIIMDKITDIVDDSDNMKDIFDLFNPLSGRMIKIKEFYIIMRIYGGYGYVF